MEDVRKENKIVTRTAVITWDDKKKMFLCPLGKITIGIVAASESKKHEDMWTPEELFIASVEGFLRDAFVKHAKRRNFDFLSYESNAEGTIGKNGDTVAFSEIKIKPKIMVKLNSQIEKAKELINLAEKDCFISNFITAQITVYPEIKTG